VKDVTIVRLMSVFYRELRAGLAPAVALRSAQYAIRAECPDPYYWAGWVAAGEAHVPLQTLPK
jgi:CHAT domain-containing protein